MGIMALYWNDQKQLEEIRYFKQLSVLGRELGLSVIVFTPEDVDHSRMQIRSLIYDVRQGLWIRKWTPFPDVIFDRCRYQPNKRFEMLRKFRAKYPHLTYLNRPLANKWIIHELFSDDSVLSGYLPDTKYYSDFSVLSRMLQKHKTVYFKPINGTGGRGILKIRGLGSKYVVQGRNHRRTIIRKQVLTKPSLNLLMNRLLTARKYVVQQGIQIELKDGRVHDFRILIQKNSKGDWEYTGGACRIGPVQSITSNLHGGGRAIRMDSMLLRRFPKETAEKIKDSVEALSLQAVHVLEKKYGQLCELALDIAIDRHGKVYLLEINPKPAREVFRRIGDKEAYRRALLRPLEYALHVYQSKHANQTADKKDNAS
ncbi:YheC/YheD family protein [Marinicrinis lubricantis]